MKTAVVIQARMNSTRLPGKVLLPLRGKPLLERMIERVRASKVRFDVVVATTFLSDDDPIQALCRKIDVPCFRGHPTDLLDRHMRAACALQADIVVKIPSDCPLIDPGIIDRVLAFFWAYLGRYHYVSNLHPPTYPDGNDVECMPVNILETAWKEAKRPLEREHTTPFIWERKERFSIGNVTWESGLDYSMSHRWTIDYPDDYELIWKIYEELWTSSKPVFRLEDILAFLKANPELNLINSRYAGVNWYRNHLHELKTITCAHTRLIRDAVLA